MNERRFRKLPARYAALATPFLLSLMMSCVVSGISTLQALGPGLEALRAWPRGWALSWLIGFPTLLVALPVVRRIVALLVAPPYPR